jgi:hypothetical protein
MSTQDERDVIQAICPHKTIRIVSGYGYAHYSCQDCDKGLTQKEAFDVEAARLRAEVESAQEDETAARDSGVATEWCAMAERLTDARYALAAHLGNMSNETKRAALAAEAQRTLDACRATQTKASYIAYDDAIRAIEDFDDARAASEVQS